jgi:hypothetical protein
MADHALSLEEALAHGIPEDPFEFVDCTDRMDEALAPYRELDSRKGRWYESRWFFAHVIEMNGWLWLSLRRNDRKAIRDWRHMQKIKNALAGPEREGCEIYPAESRLHDTSNQYHIFVLPEGDQFPFGYLGRSVMTAKENDLVGGASKQRPFDDEPEPTQTREELLDTFLTQIRVPDE